LNEIITILLLFFGPLLIVNKRHELIFVIALLSILTETVTIKLGAYRFQPSFYFWLIYLLVDFKGFKLKYHPLSKYLTYDLVSVVIVGLFFGFISPWDDPNASFRKTTQQLPVRTLIGIFRTIENLSLFYLFSYLFGSGKVTIHMAVRTWAKIILISFVIGFIDTYFLGGRIRAILIPGMLALDRFTGLLGEPRGIGQLGLVSLFLFIPYIKNNYSNSKKNNLIIAGIIVSFLSMVLSFSSTALGYGALCFLIYIFWGKVRLKYIVASVPILAITVLALLSSPAFIAHQQYRIAQILLENEMNHIEGVPDIVNSLEVFDQASAAFLYLNPEHTILGVGPNTVNIPANNYVSEFTASQFESIDTMPVNGVLYLVSRSGIMALLVFVWSFFKANKKLKKNHPFGQEVNLMQYFYYLLYRNIYFFVIIAVINFSHKTKD
jgi:hypothetical protein